MRWAVGGSGRVAVLVVRRWRLVGTLMREIILKQELVGRSWAFAATTFRRVGACLIEQSFSVSRQSATAAFVWAESVEEPRGFDFPAA